jgi:hypothetical protein
VDRGGSDGESDSDDGDGGRVVTVLVIALIGEKLISTPICFLVQLHRRMER